MDPKRLSSIAILGALCLLASGCRVDVDKNSSGQEKKVQIDTPFGGMHVKTDDVTAQNVGLPAYPGSTVVTDKDGNKSVDLHMGFGDWQLRVKAVKYQSPDSQENVLAFYKKSMAQYGDVLTCQDGSPVGQPVRTREGLTCEQKKHGNVNFNSENGGIDLGKGLELRTGSESHQRIVGFESSASGQTRFALVQLDLPSGSGKSGDAN